MTNEEFAKSVKLQTSDAAVSGTLECLKRPPGRRPAEKLVSLSAWYNQLSNGDQQMLTQVLREAAEMAVFEFLCILDGVSAIEDPPNQAELVLDFTKAGQETRLNDPRQKELHNLFNDLCGENSELQSPCTNREVHPYDTGEAKDLRSKLKPGDGLTIHHVPDKYYSIQSIEGFDPDNAPVVALPKHEHRHIPPQNR